MSAPDAPLTGRVIVVTGTDLARLGATARELESDGARVVVFAGDASDPEDRAALMEMLAELPT